MSLEEDPQIADFLRQEQRIILTAENSVMQIQTLNLLPIKVGEEMVVGYYRRIHAKPLTRREAQFLVRRDLADLMMFLRPRIAPLVPIIGEVRASALLHIGLILNGGTGKRLDSMKQLWPVLQAADYETAHEIVMLSQWPQFVGVDLANRKRVLAVARMLRTGEPPTV